MILSVQNAIEKQNIPKSAVELFTLHSENFTFTKPIDIQTIPSDILTVLPAMPTQQHNDSGTSFTCTFVRACHLSPVICRL
jgi:hypothetical protein